MLKIHIPHFKKSVPSIFIDAYESRENLWIDTSYNTNNNFLQGGAKYWSSGQEIRRRLHLYGSYLSYILEYTSTELNS